MSERKLNQEEEFMWMETSIVVLVAAGAIAGAWCVMREQLADLW